MHAKNSSSWMQLGLFTGFLFLLVAIPYTVYLKSTASNHASVHITSLPANIQTPSKTTPQTTNITTPPATATTTCLPVAPTYTLPTVATPSAYLFTDDTGAHQVCFPPALPPFPFTWDVYKDYVHGMTFDTPSNWATKSLSLNGTTIHNYYQETPTATSSADISFAWYKGQDPYASNAAYFKQPITINSTQGTIYSKGRSFIAAIFPNTTGYFSLSSTTTDAAFYAFQHILMSMSFTQ